MLGGMRQSEREGMARTAWGQLASTERCLCSFQSTLRWERDAGGAGGFASGLQATPDGAGRVVPPAVEAWLHSTTKRVVSRICCSSGRG